MQLDLCRACRGLWFDRNELKAFADHVTDGDVNLEVRGVLAGLGPLGSASPEPVYLPCPVCQERMAPKNYAQISGIVDHTCRDHGTWARHDAAVRLVALFEGGEDRLRRLREARDNEKLRRAMQQLREDQSRLGAQLASVDTRSRWHLLLDLFGFL